MNRVLFLSYDGLTTHIGQSQVLPYIIGLAERGHSLHVVSFESSNHSPALREDVAARLAKVGVGWTACRFRNWPPLVSKLLDREVAWRTCRRLMRSGDIVGMHCRSYFAADIGLRLKRRYKCKFIFDMRGLWVDSRIEGGRWPQDHFFYRYLYRAWKEKEANFVAEADEIVVLTEAARDEINTWGSRRGAPITVIPCSLDYNSFPLSDSIAVIEARQRLGVEMDTFVLAYLGSLGTVYLFKEMMYLYAEIQKISKNARLLLIGQQNRKLIVDQLRELDIGIDPEQLLFVTARHSEVPFWLGAADAGVCFIMPTYSAIGVSPTKLGEYLSVGLPVVCNDRVGDVEEIVTSLEAGIVIRGELTGEALAEAANVILFRRWPDKERTRSLAEARFGMNIAVEKYSSIYFRLFGR